MTGSNPTNDREEALNESIEKAKISQLEFLDECSQGYVGEPWEKASPKERNRTLEKIASTHDEERAYVITEDEKELMELSNGSSIITMAEMVRYTMLDSPELLFVCLKENVYTDGGVIILENEVSKKLVKKEVDYHKKNLNQDLKYILDIIERMGDTDDAESLQKEYNEANLDAKSVEYARIFLSYLDVFRGTLAELMKRTEKGNLVELGEKGFFAGSCVIFTDSEQYESVKIDARYYSGLKREFPKAKFFGSFKGDYPFVSLYEGGEIKAIVQPLLGYPTRTENFLEKIRGV